MIDAGLLSPGDRADLIGLARDGSAARRLARRNRGKTEGTCEACDSRWTHSMSPFGHGQIILRSFRAWPRRAESLPLQASKEVARLKTENAELRDEIARLEGLKGRPKLKSSGMEK